jgi:hypothetical protein
VIRWLEVENRDFIKSLNVFSLVGDDFLKRYFPGSPLLFGLAGKPDRIVKKWKYCRENL